MAQEACNGQKAEKRITTADYLEKVLKTQELRAIASSKWEKEFRCLLNEEISDDEYLKIVQSLMSEFQSVSNTMKEIADVFDKKNLKKLSKKIRKLQEFEKEKMSLTILMQQKIVTARPTPKKNDDKDKHEHKHNHNHKKHDCQHKDPIIWRPRMYEEKQNFAMIIEQINDLLAEIREIKYDLKMSQQITIKGTNIKIQSVDESSSMNDK